MKVQLKNMPRLKLADLLRRRKMTLGQFLAEHGITTYGGLSNRCDSMGVTPPTEAEFDACAPPKVNNPQEGVVVLEPPTVVDELSGKKIDPEAPVVPEVKVITEPAVKPTEPRQKKAKAKKESQPSVAEPNYLGDTPPVYEDD
jgi:hypothetical protein